MFFDSSLTASKPQAPSLIPRCGACGLSEGCNSPKMPVTGKGRKGILIVAEAPGAEEDKRNEQLIGPAGQLLRTALRKFDIDLDRDCWKTNALICSPPDNRAPSNDEIDYCRPNVLKAIRDLQPRIIIPFGGAAIRSVIGPIWRDDPGPVATWVGWNIPCQRYNSWIAPNYHLSFVQKAEGNKGEQASREAPVIRLWFEEYLRRAVELKGRPWEVVPDYTKEVKVVEDVEAAARWIDEKIKTGGRIAFDFETNRLKPDHVDAEIVCCSVCWQGKDTIAYPWAGAAIAASKRLFVSDLPKMGWNKKFEERWARAKVGVAINNWVWDGMLSAHHLDCRKLITSAKFQGFVRCGAEDWGAGIRPYLSEADSRGFNKVRQVNLRSLLLYCGIDSLIEFIVGGLQRKEMLCQ